ncbi:MAG: single-strand binding protein [Firmicutes bacterium]|nr:single-strand binding protein [Bacillota bacterium]
MNQSIITGKAWEPEIKYGNSGTCIAQISISVYDGKDKDGNKQYFSILVKAFKETAEQIGNSIIKGDNVIVCGRLKLEKWEKDGQKQSRMVLIADSIGKDIRFNNQDNHGFGGQSYPEEAPF